MHSLYGVVRPVEGAKLATIVELRLKPCVFQQLSKSGARLVELVFDNVSRCLPYDKPEVTLAPAMIAAIKELQKKDEL